MSFMLEEIFDQPGSLRETFEAEREHAAEFREFARRKGFRLIVLVARGTSDNAALAEEKGLNPDEPRSLKIVTQTV